MLDTLHLGVGVGFTCLCFDLYERVIVKTYGNTNFEAKLTVLNCSIIRWLQNLPFGYQAVSSE